MTVAPTPAATDAPKSTLPSGSSSSAASPFGAFASTSGFAGAGAAGAAKAKPTPKPVTSGSNGFGAFSGAASSPFATFGSAASTPKEEKEGDGEKAEAEAQPEEAKRVFKEQEGEWAASADEFLSQMSVADSGSVAVITGEEDEEVLHSVRSKLYAMVDGGWVERGAGLFKLNGVPGSGSSAARLVMRADATHRLLLNAPLFAKFAIDVFQEKYVRFVVIEGAGPISYMLRVSYASPVRGVRCRGC